MSPTVPHLRKSTSCWTWQTLIQTWQIHSHHFPWFFANGGSKCFHFSSSPRSAALTRNTTDSDSPGGFPITHPANRKLLQSETTPGDAYLRAEKQRKHLWPVMSCHWFFTSALISSGSLFSQSSSAGFNLTSRCSDWLTSEWAVYWMQGKTNCGLTCSPSYLMRVRMEYMQPLIWLFSLSVCKNPK